MSESAGPQIAGEDVGQQEVRPRFGMLTRADGSSIPLVFVPSGRRPGEFRALRASDYQPLLAEVGDDIHLDALGEGQCIFQGYASPEMREYYRSH